MGRHFNRAIVKSVNGAFLREVPRAEAEGMLEGEFPTAIRLSRKKDPNLVVMLLNVERLNDCAPSGITSSEVMANAGLFGKAKDEKFDEDGVLVRHMNFAFEAQTKIAAWPTIGDTKAVCVRPRVAAALAMILFALITLPAKASESLYPNSKLTPGVVRTTNAKQVCNGGSTKQFRKTTAAMKAEVYKAYGVAPGKGICAWHQNGKAREGCEIDHLISLELGGADDVRNLWPEPYSPAPGAHEKDAVENWLHKQVCSGKLSLVKAQKMIVGDWYHVYICEMGMKDLTAKPKPAGPQVQLKPKHEDENAARSGWSSSQPGVSQRKLVQVKRISLH